MLVADNRLRVLIGIGLTWTCAFIFSYGFTHATLDDSPFVFPVFQGPNLIIFLTAPIAQSAFYLLARRSSWLLNVYLVMSVACCAIAWLNLTTDGGYRFTLWHQGDFECLNGCNDAWIFGYLVLIQGCVLVFASSTLNGLLKSWRVALRLALVAALALVLVTSCAIMISM
jgi:hypothetical protein